MNRDGRTYEVFLDHTAIPPMFGIRCGGASAVGRISTDFQEVSRLARRCNECGLSDIHLQDVAEDFGRS